MGFPLLVGAAMLYCKIVIPTNMRSETYYDPYKCLDCPNINNDIKFHLYTKRNPKISHDLIPDDNATLNGCPFDPQNPTVIIIHGFTGDGMTESSQWPKDAYLLNGEYNVILVDWGSLAKGPDYCGVIKRMPVTGTYIAQLIKWIEKIWSVPPSRLHLIGFSLGAHICGMVGEALARIKSQKIGRITGLDPAGPAFENNNGLDASDATFVDIVHTNTKMFGISKRSGHVDFYVNGGKTQPGCKFLDHVCNHKRAWKYYTQSISTPHGFPAYKCSKAKLFRKSTCSPHHCEFMGLAANNKSEGKFTVKVKSIRPYIYSSKLKTGCSVDEMPPTDDKYPYKIYTYTPTNNQSLDVSYGINIIAHENDDSADNLYKLYESVSNEKNSSDHEDQNQDQDQDLNKDQDQNQDDDLNEDQDQNQNQDDNLNEDEDLNQDQNQNQDDNLNEDEDLNQDQNQNQDDNLNEDEDLNQYQDLNQDLNQDQHQKPPPRRMNNPTVHQNHRIPSKQCHNTGDFHGSS